MEPNVKLIVGGVTLFILGGLSVYLITSRLDADIVTPSTTKHAHAMPVADAAPAYVSSANTSASITDAESFYEAAEARREQQLIDKAEAERLAKLTAIKERSVECKFWKQQQKTSSAAAKIEEKVIEYCTLQTTSSSESISSDATSEAASSNIAEQKITNQRTD